MAEHSLGERFGARVAVLRGADRGRPAVVFLRDVICVSRSGGCLVALLGAVDGAASDTEQVSEFGGAVLTGLEQADQMCFLPGVELGLLAAQVTPWPSPPACPRVSGTG